jgi:signal transduction histidine kinase/CheY-like chemotaxis protein
MTVRQQIFRERRQYNQWVANETLEDYALRFTALKARRWSSFRVANTALGTVAFLALEAIGGTITLTYGFTNAAAAIMIVGLVIFLTGIPIAYYAAKYGVDIDLLTRGAGFGYIGSTITSLIYASFTFIFFAIEAAIMALALELCFGIPPALGYLISALLVIPLVTHGITLISRFQLMTQLLWLGLQLLPLVALATGGLLSFKEWTSFSGHYGPADGHFDLLLFGGACSVIFALIAQTGEQVDFLRFMPPPKKDRDLRWWFAVMAAGPGWIFPGILKLLAGSFLAVLVLRHGVPFEHAGEPSQMYFRAFSLALGNPAIAMALTGIFVVVSQLKINVTNAYAGSLAWSNFFSRLTHSHPGRVVWLIFNVALALLLMELGIYKALESTLGLYSNIPVAWLSVITADLIINKPLGLSPPGIEFKRAYLYDINPVGVGSMIIAAVLAMMTYTGVFGSAYQGMAPFVALAAAMLFTPLIAFATRGRYYIARKAALEPGQQRCVICEHEFEPQDMAGCPVYDGPICSLCCSLDARCHDSCKDGASFASQITAFFAWALPASLSRRLSSRLGKYVGLLLLLAGVMAAVFWLIYIQFTLQPVPRQLIADLLTTIYFILLIFVATAAWPFVLAQESSLAARQETQRQTSMLMNEIEAHKRTDAELQKAKETAEAASLAKSKYVRGISHELRTPLNAIVGYGQLLEGDSNIPAHRRNAIRVIRRSGEHLSGLVDGLLDISMIEAGRLQIFRDEVLLSDFLHPIIDMFALQAQEKGLQFSTDLPKTLPVAVYTDEKRLRQILINLLSNAIRCTERGYVALRIQYRNEVARIDIEDSGPGIAEGDLERIFEPFERIHTPGHPLRAGTGLGLTITKLFTESLGGEITVESTPGKGSVFGIKLLLSAVPDGRSAAPPLRRVQGYEGRRRTVLVADDDQDHVDLMQEMLIPLGFIVIVARDGGSCLALAQEVDPDIVLLDLSMPDMNGWEVSRHLRQSTQKSLPVAIISANPREDRFHDEASFHHDAYLMKPVKVSALLEALEQLLGLTWLYSPTLPQADRPRLPDPLLPEQIPMPERLDALRGLGETGHIRGLQQALDALAVEQPAAQPLIDYLRMLVNEIELSEFDRVLRSIDDRVTS